MLVYEVLLPIKLLEIRSLQSTGSHIPQATEHRRKAPFGSPEDLAEEGALPKALADRQDFHR